MDRSKAFYLVTDTYEADDIGQLVSTTTKRLVYGRIGSITRAEWNAAGELGIKPEYTLTMFGPDYAGEKTVMMDINGVPQMFGVYRTYHGTNDDLELYLEWKVGDSNGPTPVDPEPPTPSQEDNNGEDAVSP